METQTVVTSRVTCFHILFWHEYKEQLVGWICGKCQLGFGFEFENENFLSELQNRKKMSLKLSRFGHAQRGSRSKGSVRFDCITLYLKPGLKIAVLCLWTMIQYHVANTSLRLQEFRYVVQHLTAPSFKQKTEYRSKLVAFVSPSLSRFIR